MKPILFAETATTYTTNGIGRLSDAISCVVTEERNGMYELAMVYPVTGQHYSDIGIRKIIVAKPFEGGTLQAFRIYEISKPINGKVEVFAQHISYDLSKNVAMPFSVSASPTACAAALAGLKSNAVETCPFTFWTDVTTGASYNQAVPATIRSRLGGVEGSVLDQFGGEYEWDNFTVKLHRQRGRVNTGITLRYGKNITDLTQEENIASTITGLVPFWADSDGNLVTLDEKAVYSQYASRYSTHLTDVIDMSGDFESQPTKAALKLAAEALVNKSTFGLPKVSIEVSFVALWQTEEYKDIAPLESVNLCDEITVHFDRLGVDATAKIVKTEYDVLKEKYLKVHIGSVRSSLSQIVDDNNAKTIQAIQAQKVETATAINNATKWLTTAGGYVIAIKNTDGTWKELVFSDNVDPYSAQAHILRINNNGLGFSTGGMNGTYRNAWTIDGNLVADFIHGGTLTLGGNGNDNGWLKIVAADGQTIIGKWTKDGIDVGKGSIHGANLSLGANGGDNNNDGTLTIYGWNSSTNQRYVIGTWNKTGLTINKGVIQLGTPTNNVYPFQVLNTGEMTAKSGSVGGFTIDANTIRSGNTGSTSDGAVTLANNDFSRTINGATQTALRLAIGAKFGVKKDGTLYATDGVFKGDITGATGSFSGSLNGATGTFGGDITSGGNITVQAGKFKQLGSGYLHLNEDTNDSEPAWIFDLGPRYCNCMYSDGSWHWVNGGATSIYHYLLGAYNPSDRRYKKDITDIDRDFSKALILNIDPISFRYTYDDAVINFGAIAQDVKVILDNLGFEEKNGLVYVPEDEETDKWSIEYKQFIPHLINTVKDLYAEISTLKAEIKALKERA